MPTIRESIQGALDYIERANGHKDGDVYRNLNDTMTVLETILGKDMDFEGEEVEALTAATITADLLVRLKDEQSILIANHSCAGSPQCRGCNRIRANKAAIARAEGESISAEREA